ncbi:MAG TPA: hypothetical protein VFB36_08590 [Nevskiaceae bacterium]|nr:hypothetical protein [Nevskiaceae bacterium]
MLRRLGVLVGLIAPALPAWSAADGFVDAYYVPSAQIKESSPGFPEESVSGDGVGVHATVPLGQLFFVNGEFQHNNYSDSNSSGHINEYRAGGGIESSPDKARAAVYGEYIRLDPEKADSADGFGLHARVTFDVIPPLNLFGEVGYVRLTANGDTIDGPEFLIGGAFSFTKYIAAFADYRISHLDGNGENESKDRLYDVRVGVRLNLGPVMSP